MQNRILSALAAFIIVNAMSVFAYGYDGAAPFCPAPTVDLTGTWIVRSVGENDCPTYPKIFGPMTLTITQSGDTIAVDSPIINFTDGQICGNTVTWRGVYPDVEFGGTNYQDVFYLQVTPGGKSFLGLDHWVWILGNDTCAGTDSFTGVKLH